MSQAIIEEYWMNELKAFKSSPSFFGNVNSKENGGDSFISGKLDRNAVMRILELSGGSDILTYNFYATALKALLARYEEDDFLFLSPLNQFTDTSADSSLFFSKCIGIKESSFKELFSEYKNELLNAIDHSLEWSSIQEVFDQREFFDDLQHFGLIIGTATYNDPLCKPNTLFRFIVDETTPRLEVSSSLYKLNKDLTALFLDNFNYLLDKILVNLYEPLIGFTVNGLKEQDLLKQFNTIEPYFPTEKNVLQLIDEHVANQGEVVALKHNEDSISYKGLYDSSNQFSRYLKAKFDLKSDDLVGVMMARSINMANSVLAIWRAGGGFVPLGITLPNETLLQIIDDSGLRIIITDDEAFVNQANSLGIELSIVNLNEVNKEIIAYSNAPLEFVIGKENLAYVIYTSGSTGKPKGVMIEHWGMLNHMGAKIHEMSFGKGSVVAQNAPHTFDISIWQMFAPLVAGSTTVIIDEEDIIDVEKFIGKMVDNAITVLELVPSYLLEMLDFLEVIDANFKIEILILNAETLTKSMVARWLDLYPKIPIVNTYGATEVSDDISHYIMYSEPESSSVPVMKGPIQNFELHIIDENFSLVPIGVKGELVIAGPGVGRGYINDKVRTEKSFLTGPIEGITDQKRAYRTGDFGRYMPDGSMEFLGRNDNQVKILGHRIELDAIENLTSELDEVRDCKAVAYVDQQIIAVYYLADKSYDKSLFEDHLSSKLAKYMMPSCYIHMDAFPLTANGKVNKKALPNPKDLGINSSVDYVEPRNDTERRLTEIWKTILVKKQIGVLDNFFELGGHSLRATRLIRLCEQEFNVRLSIKMIFENVTIRDLAILISKSDLKPFEAISRAEEKEFYELSSAQRRIYFLNELDKNNLSYNMPWVQYLGLEVDRQRVKTAFSQLIERHEGLRTSFINHNGTVLQKINDYKEQEIEVFSTSIDEFQNVVTIFVRPFELTKAPLVRLGLIHIESIGYALIKDEHHIISDGISNQILVDEFLKLYKGESLEPLKLQFKDYSEWQFHLSKSDEFIAQENYWKTKLKGKLPVLDLPIDNPRPTIFDFKGNTIGKSLSNKSFDFLKELTRVNGATLQMTMVAIMNVLLHKKTGQNDIIIGCGVAGRRHEDLENVIGMFVNSIPIRNQIEESQSFHDFFKSVINTSLEAYDNQDIQFDDMVSFLNVERLPSRNPIFDVLIVVQNFERSESLLKNDAFTGELSEELSSNLHFKNESAKFDLTFFIWEGTEDLYVSLEYYSSIFNKESMELLLEQFINIIDQLSESHDVLIKDLGRFDENEIRSHLNKFARGPQNTFDPSCTIHSLFSAQALKTPKATAVVDRFSKISYETLENNSNRIAAFLFEKLKVQNEERVGILQFRTTDLISSILGVMKSGGVYVPLDPSLPEERLLYVLEDSSIKTILVESNLKGVAENLLAKSDLVVNIVCVDSEESKQYFDVSDLRKYEGKNVTAEVDKNSLCYVMYTSGSTGLPKGVLVEHNSILRLAIEPNFVPLNESSVLIATGASSFDATSFEYWSMLLNGGKLVLLEKDELLDVVIMRDKIEAEGVNTMWFPTGLLNELIDNDVTIFSKLKYLMVGGETLSPKHMRYLKESCPEIQLSNVYGPTENTTFSLHYPIIGDVNDNIPIGRPVSNSSVYILDEQNNPLGVGIVGEIVVGGEGVARGYQNKSELTSEVFFQSSIIGTERLYRSGDLGRWNAEGAIEFVGRKDNQVKIGGFRVELGEVEHSIRSLKDIQSAVVIKSSDNKSIMAFVISALTEIDSKSLLEELSTKLPAYMVPSELIPIDKFPLNKNGKVDRQALIEFYAASKTKLVEAKLPTTALEVKIAKIWSELLNVSEIFLADDFFVIGGHSLKAMSLISIYSEAFGVKVSLHDIFGKTTLSEHVVLLSEAEKMRFEEIPVVDIEDNYPLSDAQRRLWVLSQFEEASVAYNMPFKISLDKDVNIEKFEQAINITIKRHEILRTFFKENENGEPRQWVIPVEDVNFEIQYMDLRSSESIDKDLETCLIEDILTPFDLSSGPLLRAYLLRIEDEQFVFYYNMHHIISDGWSMEVLSNDTMTIYDALINDTDPSLPKLRIQYKDYSAWQLDQLNNVDFLEHRKYWLDNLSGELPLIELPSRKLRPGVKTYNGQSLSTYLSAETTRKLKDFGQEQGGSLFISLMSCWNVMFHLYSGNKEIVLGSVVAGRDHVDLKGQIGFYVRTLALKNTIDPKDSFEAFYQSVKENTLSGFDNQTYPFDRLVDELDLKRDTSRNPVFDILFTHQNIGEIAKDQDIKTTDIDQILDHGVSIAKFDLEITFVEVNDLISMKLNFNTDVYEKEMIEQLMVHFKSLANQLVTSPKEKISLISFLSSDEEQRIITSFNSTQVAYPKNKSIAELFEEQVSEHPDQLALVFEGNKLSYAELNEQSNQLAAYLKKKYNVKPDDFIGIVLEPSEQTIVAVLAVLKSGGAYVPIDVEYPNERIKAILEDCNCKVVINKDELDVFKTDKNAYSKDNLNCDSTGQDLAYVMYTSGSTGRPKGVLIEQQSVVRLVKNSSVYNFSSKDALLSTGSFSFDATTMEFWGPLLNGGTLVQTTQDSVLNAQKLSTLIQQHDVNVMWFTSGLLNHIVDVDISVFKDLSTIFVGGDKLSPAHISKLRSVYNELKIVNGYGPTENTTFSLNYSISEVTGNIPIGKPISNSTCYILNENFAVQPIGVEGEIFVGGDGLARGYLNQPTLTLEKFVEHPFIDGERLYRTGDMGRWLPDGNIQFTGRQDDQVKIRGYRIELGEIEHAIQSIEYINKVIVVAIENSKKEKELVAYLSSEVILNVADFSKELKEILPGYMHPTYYVQLDEFPLTVNGKVDKKALPLPVGIELNSGIDYVGPRNKVEEKLVSIWESVLGREKIGINDDFFELGGQSLKALQVIAQVRTELDVQIGIKNIFTESTIEKLAFQIQFILNQREIQHDKNELFEIEL